MLNLRTRAVTVLATMMLAALVLPVPLFAHAHLKRSVPAAGATLAVAPTAITLWFTEAPELTLSGVTLRDSAGTPVALGALEADLHNRLVVHLPILGPVHAGRYTVQWHAVASDGHPSAGAFTFAMARDANAAPAGVGRASPTAAATVGPSELAPAEVAVRGLWFTATLIVIGAVLFRLVVLDRARAGAESDNTIAQRLATFGALAAAALLAAAWMRLRQQHALLVGDGAPTLDTMVWHTAWGGAWLLEVGSGAGALVALGFASRRDARVAWGFAVAACVGLALAPALGGHAAASAHFTSLAIAVDAIHVFAASGWLGGLCCLAVVAIPVLVQSPAADRWKTVASTVNAFSPLALSCATLVALTGGISAWLRVRTVHALLTSSYGHVLELKIALVLLTACVGAYNWRRARPALGTEAGTARLRRSAATELALALTVIVVTAVLVAMDLPAP